MNQTNPTTFADPSPRVTTPAGFPARLRHVSTTTWWFIVAQLAVIAPIWLAALRDGHRGWFPTLDAANTVLRARDVFGPHTPLVGMWSSVSIKLGTPTYFPGATELYALAIPVKIFGNAWGPLLAMAVINSIWLLIAGWLLRRRLGTVGATWALTAFALLVWTMGSEALVDVAPMQMITIPFAVFLVAVWSVADRDVGTIWVLAILANYLVLNHLVLTMLVPVIGLCAPVALGIALVRARRRSPEQWPTLRRSVIRQMWIAAGITVVLWLPTLIQQFTTHPGNLTNLWHASQVDLQRTVSAGKALSVVVSMLAVPPFWLRDTFSSPFIDGPDGFVLIAVTVAVVAAIAVLFVVALRRHDRLVVSALAVASVAVVASVANVLAAPTDFGFRTSYFRSLWGTAMFLWLALGVAVVRSLPHRQMRKPAWHVRTGAIGMAAVLIVALAAVPHADPGTDTNGSTDASVALAAGVMGPSVEALRHKGQVRVFAAGNFSSFALSSALILALASNGIDVCVPPSTVDQYGAWRACRPGGPDTNAMVSSAAYAPLPGQHVIAEATLLTRAEQDQQRADAAKITSWLARQHEIRPSPRVERRLVRAYGQAAADKVVAEAFATNGQPMTALINTPTFAAFIDHRSFWRADGTADAAIRTGNLSPEVLVRWANLTQREYIGESVRISTIDNIPESAFAAPSNANPYGNNGL